MTGKSISTWRINQKRGAFTMRNFRRFDPTATTWKTLCLLLLMFSTFDFPPDKFARAEPIRTYTEKDPRDSDRHVYSDAQEETETSKGLPRRTLREDENSSEFVGNWRNNGEALEPKWRDGDTAPVLPFSYFATHTIDEADSNEQLTGNHGQGSRHHESNGRENYKYSHSKNGRRVSHFDYEDDEGTDRRRVYSERNRSLAADKDAISARYREPLRVPPNDYEHELNDEEYLKPRPRKRRPPQNYEFALAANEATLRDRKVADNSRPWSSKNDRGSSLYSESRSDVQLSRNAVELKSLLKMQQEEGLSLSEILQRRNLTLSDLLRGKTNVITALRSKDIDDTDYIEEASRMTSNSFMKISTTGRPSWISTTEFEELSNTKKEDLVTPSGSSVQRSPIVETTSAITEESILVTLDPSPAKVTRPPAASAVITTSAPFLDATNSMEFYQSDDGSVKLQNSGERKGSEEDEIMEFSDFTDYKKGRNSASPVWLMAKEEDSTKSSVEVTKDKRQDGGSTLSIEHLLSPTEPTTSIQNSSTVSMYNEELDQIDQSMINRSDIQLGNTLVDHNRDVIIDQPMEDHGILLEHEYQDDGPSTEDSAKLAPASDKNDLAASMMREIESTIKAMSEDSDRSNEHYRSILKHMPEEKNHNFSLENHQRTVINDKRSYEDTISEVEPEARAEIFELFASGSAGRRLERLLKSRNMSVEELIALRQRGSSKVHLAEVSRLKVQKLNVASPIEADNTAGRTTSLPSRNFGEFEYPRAADVKNISGSPTEERTHNRINIFQSKSYENNTDTGDSMSSPVKFIDIVENTTDQGKYVENINEENEKQVIKDESHRMVDIVDLLTTFASLPFAKEIQRDSMTDCNDASKRKLSIKNCDPGSVVLISNNRGNAVRTNDSSSDVLRSGYLEEVAKGESNSIDIQTIFSETSRNFNDDNNEETEDGKTLSKVKPSIIASGAILGVTIVVFLAIFIICRIRQKQKYRYRNAFSRAVFQGPVMAARKLSNSSSLSAAMVNVIATSTTKRPERNEIRESTGHIDPTTDIDNDSLDANDSWETIPDYMK